MNNKLVNGPVNAFRLEGKIENNNKIIYLFSDYHNHISYETKCDSYISDDFIKYFYKTMKKTDKNIIYDFLFENFSNIDMFDEHKYYKTSYREKYLNEIRSFIDSDMNIIEKNIKQDNILENKGSKSFSNLRLHYLDIRSFIGLNDIDKLINNLDYYIKTYNFTLSTYWMIDKLIIDFMNLKNELKFFVNIISKHSKNKEKKFKDNIFKDIKDENIYKEIKLYYNEQILPKEKRMDKYFIKIFKKYENNNIKDKLIKSEIFKNIFTYSKKVISYINFCIRKLLIIKNIGNIDFLTLNKYHDNTFYYGNDTYKLKKNMFSINLKYNLIYDIILNIYCFPTDLYCLRRILDKNYINNVIVYSGMYHTNNYIKTLIQNFDFKITHLEYSKLSLEDTNKLIKSKKKYDHSELFAKPQLKQCTNMSKFPDLFL